jgi:hypothetical protein
MSFSPPEVLDDDFDYVLDDPGEALHERLRELRTRAPAAWVRCGGRPAVMFTSYELVDAAFRDEETFPGRRSTSRSPRRCWGETSSACAVPNTRGIGHWCRRRFVHA